MRGLRRPRDEGSEMLPARDGRVSRQRLRLWRRRLLLASGLSVGGPPGLKETTYNPEVVH